MEYLELSCQHTYQMRRQCYQKLRRQCYQKYGPLVKHYETLSRQQLWDIFYFPKSIIPCDIYFMIIR